MTEQTGKDDPTRLRVRILENIDEIPARDWDAMLRDDCPFLKHGFLAALERNHCVGHRVGWIPRHLCLYDRDRLAAAMPLYEKHNSWGEFVFDHAWADAYRRHGLEYYPKLVNAVPFTPVTGQRVLVRPQDDARYVSILLDSARSALDGCGYSSLHCLFPDRIDRTRLDVDDTLVRSDCHFQWHNRDYESFENFLEELKSRKRKNIRQERRKVAQSDVSIRWLSGREARETDWHDFVDVYTRIYERKYGMPAFNLGFFLDIAQAMPDQVLLALADCDKAVVAGALLFRDEKALYGRIWGSRLKVDCLHFELCYYTGIEYCIREGLARFDPGVQGEHKIARGFVPAQTHSLHWIASQPFRHAIRQFLDHEERGVRHYMNEIERHSAYGARS